MCVRETGEKAVRDHTLRRQRIRTVAAFLVTKSRDEPGDIALPANEVERPAVLCVVEPAVFFRVRAENVGQLGVRDSSEKRHGVVRAIAGACR